MDGYFEVVCCGRRRGMLPGNVMVCSKCDFSHEHGTGIPNERLVKDIAPGIWQWPIRKKKGEK